LADLRFSEVVNSSGKPDAHLLLIDPAKDKTLQAAIKSNRVMTIYQASESTKTDYGTVGFEEGASRQFLLFPKTLKPFADRRIIGIKYNLLESMPVSKDEAAPKPKSGKAAEPTRGQAPTEIDDQASKPKDDKADKPRDDQPKTGSKSLADVALAKFADTVKSKKKTSVRVDSQEKKPAQEAPPAKVVEFPASQSNEQRSDRSAEMEELKRRVRAAMEVLEQGKQVAAYNLLKRIVEG
jgi:hypothetical protein